MVIKPADDKEPYLASLDALCARADVTAALRKRIEQDIRFTRAGMKGERDAAYEINFYYGDTSENFVAIHHLRLEHKGRVAQIDHLLIGRTLCCFVLETKSFSEGVGVNEHGDFPQFYAGRPQGVASPLEQNEKHVAVLQAVLSSGRVALPTRLGMTMSLSCKGLVVVSKTARVSRPKKAFPGLENILKIDQLSPRLDKEADKSSLLKIVSRETLRDLARAIAALHVPAPLPTGARYGLPAESPVKEQVSESKPLPSPEPEPICAPKPVRAPEAPPGQNCQGCSGPVSPAEARFSRLSATKFGGRVLCRSCQQNSAAPAPAVAAAAPSAPAPAKEAAQAPAKYQCATCAAPLEYAVAKFCWMNKRRFGDSLYCRDHQALG